MKKGAVWFLLLAKRQMKKVSLYVILLIMTAVCLLIRYVADELSVSIVIGVVNEDDGEMTSRIEEGLYGHRGILVFRRFDTYEELKGAVQSGEVMGGYVLKKDFSKRLLEGDEDESIEALSTPNSMFAGIANEIFFSFVMKEISYEELVKDTEETGLFRHLEEQEIRDGLRHYFDTNLSDGSTFAVKYDRDLGEFAGQSIRFNTYDYLSPVIVGVVGLMVFVGGLSGMLSYYDDRNKGSLLLLCPIFRQATAAMESFIPSAVIGAAGVLILRVTGMETDIIGVTVRYFLYAFIVTGYCFVLKTIIRKKEIYVSFIPVLVLLSVIFCPVFVNLSAISGGMTEIGKALPLYWLYML